MKTSVQMTADTLSILTQTRERKIENNLFDPPPFRNFESTPKILAQSEYVAEKCKVSNKFDKTNQSNIIEQICLASHSPYDNCM